MIISMRNIVFPLGVCVVVFFSLTQYAAAYSVSPLIINHTVEVRAIETDDIVIVNNGPAVLQLFPAVNNITLGAGGGIESFLEPSMSDRTTTLTSWLELSRKPIELRPGEIATTTLTLRVNPNAEPGTYHALISFPDGRNRDEAEVAIPSGNVPGVVMTVTIEKKTVEQLGLGNFHVDRFVVSEDNEAVSYTVSNTGDTDMHPTGDILIYNARGEEVGSLQVNPESKLIQPGEKIEFKSKLSIQGLVGKYKAYLSLHYGVEGRAQLQDTAYFYAVPWKKLLILFFGLLCVAIALSLFVHRRYVKEPYDDDSDYVPLKFKEGRSEPVHHDIDMKPRI